MRKILYISLLLLLTACYPSVLDCTYHVECSVETTSGAIVKTPNEIISYVFYIDELMQDNYSPSSYEEALSGMISVTKEPNKVIEADLVGVYESEIGLLVLPNVTGKYIVIVVCDIENEICAYRDYEVGENLYFIKTSLVFKPYLFTGDNTEVTNSGWSFKI